MGNKNSNSCFIWMIITLIINISIAFTGKISSILPQIEIWNYFTIGVNAICFIWFIIARIKESHYYDVYVMIIANIVLTIAYLCLWYRLS